MRRLYGEPYYTNDKGGITGINEAFWSGMYAAENIVLHEPDEKTFYRYNPETGIYAVETADVIRHVISCRMLEASRQARVFELKKKRPGDVEQRGGAPAGHGGETRCFRGAKTAIHLGNRVIAFREGEAELRPFSAEYRSRNRSPIAFDGDADVTGS